MKEPVRRGRLSKIDMLPPAADAAVAWAIVEVRKGRLTQTEISAEMNRLLAVVGLGPIPRTTFNRWVTTGLTGGFPPRGGNEEPPICPRCGASLLSRRSS